MSAKKILIAYFSRRGQNYVSGNIVDLKVGNTEAAMRSVAELTGGDLFEIAAVDAYPADYEECTQAAQRELRSGARPRLAGALADPASYDTVVLGYPNWWSTMPMPVFTFLESVDLAGKLILPLCTHEGSGLGNSEADLRRLCPQARVGKGLAVKGSSAQKAGADIAAWLKKSGVLA